MAKKEPDLKKLTLGGANPRNCAALKAAGMSTPACDKGKQSKKKKKGKNGDSRYYK